MSSVRNFYSNLRDSNFWRHTIWYGVTWFLSAALLNCGYGPWIVWTAIWYLATALFIGWSTLYFWWSDAKLRRLERELAAMKAENEKRRIEANGGLKYWPKELFDEIERRGLN